MVVPWQRFCRGCWWETENKKERGCPRLVGAALIQVVFGSCSSSVDGELESITRRNISCSKVEEALARGSNDNISCLVIFL